ncbi:MAG: non-ribosomal peptide synthetase, partial [Candidatus Parabeggiatoa sp. nov. 1]
MKTTSLIKTNNHYPLSSPQRDIWFDQILHPDVPLYNVGGYARIDGPISPARFEKAINQVIQENDALRIILHEGESLPTQTFAENVHLKLEFHDFSDKENAHELAIKWMEQEFVKPFQLYDGLLFRFALCKAEANCYYWLKKYHHLIADGWAISLIVQRVAAAYNALSTGKTSEPKNFAYPNFIQNDQAYFESEKFVKAKRYWQEKYREVPEPLIVRSSATQFQGKTVPSQRSTLCLQRPFYNQIIDFAKENKASTFHVILGALYCYFVRTCHREDFAIGLPTLNRSTAAFKQTVGLFVGVSPAWFRFGTELNFVELVENISKELQGDYRHQRFPLGEINRQVGLHQQLFDLTLSYAKHDYDTNFNGNPARTSYLTNGFEQNALAIFIEEFHQQDDVNIYFDYNLGAFDKAEIERLKARFEFILGEILRQSSVPIRALQIMPDAELKKILVEWNDTVTDYPRDKTIVDLFEEQVAKTPDAIAVVFENQQLTCQELNAKANQLAHYLQHLGVKPDALVGICIGRSLEMVIGLLGILKAGGAYLPLDPAYPVARLAFMLEDAQAPVLLTQSSLKEGLPETKAQVVFLDVEAETLSQFRSENLVSGATPTNLAYVIYTSGSTGNPKGVLIAHQGLCNLAIAQIQVFGVQSDSRILQFASLSFDVAISDIAMALCSGATLELITQDSMMSPSELIQILYNHSITHFEIPASILGTLPVEKLPKLQTLIVGGEACSPSVVAQWSKGRRFFNAYGPTEGTVCATVFENPTGSSSTLPIGRPIANTQIYILDQSLQPVPIGVPGELHISGVGLARGYLNHPDLTAEKFINNPFSDDPNSRLYKTGDLARYLPDGNIEYLDRIDNQVKIRGFRIELEAIETVLVQHPDVIDAVVIARKDESGEKRLVAYVVSNLIPTRIPYQSESLVKYEDKTVPLRTEDICTAGVLLKGSMSFEKGKEISLHIQLPGESEYCWLKGRVAYSRASTTGIEFKLTPKEQVLMEKGVSYELENKGFLNFWQYSLRDKLRHALKEKLPDYMVPSDFILLMSLPLTPNGKIDRRALSQLSVSNYQLSEKTFVAPRTPDEELLAGIWASVLGIERVGVHDNFFELGGHSLLAVNLMARIEQQFGKKLPLSTLVEGATIEQLATVLDQSTEKMWPSLVAIQPNGTKRPFFCVPGIGGNVTDFYELAQQLGNEQPFYGLQAVGLDGKSKPYTNIEDMATHYLKEMQTVQSQGPYLLGGYSFGGLVAF